MAEINLILLKLIIHNFGSFAGETDNVVNLEKFTFGAKIASNRSCSTQHSKLKSLQFKIIPAK